LGWPIHGALEGKLSPHPNAIFILMCNVSHQEDFYAFASLSLDPEELRLSVKKHLEIDWDPKSVDDTTARQVVFVGIYDG
jgi:hypothetical protein